MITRENYESYYIDFLDGTLSDEAQAAFVLFLEENPDLQLEDDSLPQLNSISDEMGTLEKQLMKKSEEPLIISHQTIEYALIAQVEKQLNPDEEKNLQLWLINHPEYKKEQTLYQKTIVSSNALTFGNKEELYQKTRIVPLWLSSSAVAASIVTVIGISVFFSVNKFQVSSANVPKFSKEWLHKTKKPENKITPLNPTSVDRTYSKNDTFKISPIVKKDIIEKKQDDKQNNKQDKNTPPTKSPNQNITNERGTLLPKQPEIAEGIMEKTVPVKTDDVAENYVAWSSMSNPIEPITNSLSKKLNTTIDFRRQKESKGKESGFFLKIGKFELSNKKGASKN